MNDDEGVDFLALLSSILMNCLEYVYLIDRACPGARKISVGRDYLRYHFANIVPVMYDADRVP